MSQALSADTLSFDATSGSSALSISPVRRAQPQRGPGERTRTPLSVVPARAARRRVPFVVFSFVVLVAALVTVLILNISVSSAQYELVQLRGKQVALTQENEALVQRLEDVAAPQNLAAEATKLGMVASPTFGTIDVDSLKVTGSPEAAKEGSKPLALIAAPEVVTAEDVQALQPAPPAAPAPAPEAPAEAAADAPAAAAAEPAEAAEPRDRPAAAAPDAGAAARKAQEAAAGGAADKPVQGLAGGTIPGPQQIQTNR
jgi:hypothetical protein